MRSAFLELDHRPFAVPGQEGRGSHLHRFRTQFPARGESASGCTGPGARG